MCNYSQAYEPGLSISSTGFLYAPCIIGNFPVGAVVAPSAISISPLGVYITPEGANFQPEGVDVRPPRPADASRACLACPECGAAANRPSACTSRPRAPTSSRRAWTCALPGLLKHRVLAWLAWVWNSSDLASGAADILRPPVFKTHM